MRFTYLLLLLAACGGTDAVIPDGSAGDSTTNNPDTSSGTDAQSSDTGSGTDATTDATSTDSSMTNDSGMACGLMPVDGGMGCNTLPTTGQAIKANCHGGSPPTAVGGNILDGHYVLTQIDYYNFNGGICPAELEKIDWQICGKEWETVQGTNQVAHYNLTASVMSPKLTLTVTCPQQQTLNWSYDATNQNLRFYLAGPNGSTRVSTYAKM